MEKFTEGRIYRNDKGKIICTKRDGQYAEFDVYLSCNNTNIPNMHERLEIHTAINDMYEFVFSDWLLEIHSTECIEYKKKLIDTLIMIKRNLAYAEFIGVAEGVNVYFMHEYYYKFQRTQYSKPVYFVINAPEEFGTEIRLVNGEEYEEMYTKEPCIDTGDLSNYLREFIIENKSKYGLI